MKFAICTAVLLLLLGITASAYARQEKGQEEHKQETGPAQQQAKPATRQRTQQAARTQQPQTPAANHSQQAARTQQPQTPAANHSQQAARTQQPQTPAANHSQQSNAGRNQTQVQQTHAAAGNRGSSEHGRISDAHYTSSFGSGHSFHVNRGEYDSRRFAYGGYSFGFVDPWPVGWGYSDDVYVVYADGGYYMYDRVHPGLRISISIL
jgi:cytoskeletal protein RodZ